MSKSTLTIQSSAFDKLNMGLTVAYCRMSNPMPHWHKTAYRLLRCRQLDKAKSTAALA
ncbi:hypothetical protein [Spirosoma humi]